ncbi:unnamed protein product, partial [Mesorhabditis belari]|uniref:Uncharacterized protein n=1 Tax=Mesorhabditis belari TaxID=2138241 RepID=A0AAF3J7I6_9BILA
MQTFQETAEELLGSNSERIPPEDFAGKLDIARKKAYETYDSMQKYGKKETKALEQESFRKALNEKIKSKINHHLARYRDVLFVEALKDGVDTYVQAAKLKAADLFCEVDDSAETFNELLSRHKKARSEAFELFDKRTNYFIDDEGPLVKAKRKELDKKIEEHFLATKREVASKFYRTSRTRLGNELVGVVRKSLEDSRSYVQDHHEMESFITEAQGKASLHFIGKVRELVEELTMTFEFLDSLQLEKYFNAYKSEQIERMITNEIASYKLGCETKFSLAGLKEKLNEVQEKGVGDKDKMEKEAQKWQRQAQTIFEKIQGLSAENDQRAKKRVEESEQFDSLQETFTNSDKKYDKLKAENERLERELREVKASNQLLSKVDSSAEPFVNKAKDKKRLNLATRLAANEILLGGSAEKIAEEIR